MTLPQPLTFPDWLALAYPWLTPTAPQAVTLRHAWDAGYAAGKIAAEGEKPVDRAAQICDKDSKRNEATNPETKP